MADVLTGIGAVFGVGSKIAESMQPKVGTISSPSIPNANFQIQPTPAVDFLKPLDVGQLSPNLNSGGGSPIPTYNPGNAYQQHRNLLDILNSLGGLK